MQKGDINNEEKCKQAIENFCNYITLTSKCRDRLRLEIFSSNGNVIFSWRLPDVANICDAEITAIFKCLLICEEQEWKNSLILTDSKSALDRIKRIGIRPDNEEILIKIWKIIEEEKQSAIKLVFAWIRDIIT